ncbi:hypothetical protein [Streptomyces sp. NPDC057403]|uniref:hypothetical protein n=1 Tax=Streptomyces sp. NPDC057403 TaxID=3346119 RepID=UPI0036969EF3
MKLSPVIVVGALAASLSLPAGAVQAVASSAQEPARERTARSATQVFADVSAQECIRGGGVIIINAVGDGTYTAHCEGGTHDGETIT